MNIKKISFVEIEIFLKINDPNKFKIKTIKNCDYNKVSNEVLSIKIPKLQFSEEKSFFFVFELLIPFHEKQTKINIFKGINKILKFFEYILKIVQAIACKFNGQISHFNQILHFEKYMTDSFEVSLLAQIEKEKIRYNESVLKRFYQYKVVQHLKDSSAMFGYKSRIF